MNSRNKAIYKKVKLIVAEGQAICICRQEGRMPEMEHVFTLEHFSVDGDRIGWSFKDGEGHIFEGGIASEIKLPYYPEAFVCLSLPVVMHKRDHGKAGIGVEFIFNIPQSKQIHRLDYLRQKFGIRNK